METPGSRSHTLQATFKDGLGTRYLWEGAGGALEVLALPRHLGTIATFESLIEERVTRIAQVRQDCYAHVRDVEHDADASRLAVVSDHVPGVRLSRLLAAAEQHLLPFDVDSALCLIRQLVAAVETLHEATPETWHGALAPERIVVTPDARLVLVEHVFGTALEQMRWSPERYWKELRVALPVDPKQCFTRRGDVFQSGIVALALLLGRPIGHDECPAGLGELASGTFGLGGGFEPLPQWVRSWLSRALGLDSTHAFGSAVAARQAFESGFAGSGYTASPGAVLSFLDLYHLTVGGQPETSLVTPEQDAGVPIDPDAFVAFAAPHAAAISTPRVATPAVPVSTAAGPSPAPDEGVRVAFSSLGSQADADTSRRWRLIAASVVLVALTSGGAMAARRYLTVPASSPATGSLSIQTTPAGATVVIDGQARGVTPLLVTLDAGTHSIDLSADDVHRTVAVTIAPNADVSQFIDMPQAASAVGQLEVRTDPPGAKVSVDGERRGVSPLSITGLAPGSHTVTLESDLGAVDESVMIQPGATASLVVPLNGPQGAPVSGWISIAAPAEVQVFENQRLLGTTRIDRIMVASGRHDLEFVNEALGYRTAQTVQVAPGQVATVKAAWPMGTLAINAAPWANVTLDGQELGETPLGNTQVPIGTHDVVFRHPQLGEQRQTVTVTAETPARVSVDMRKK